MKRFFLTFFVFYLSLFLVSEERKIEDCTLIGNDKERLSCFDSFFKTDKKLILVDQEDIIIFEEKIEDADRQEGVITINEHPMLGSYEETNADVKDAYSVVVLQT